MRTAVPACRAWQEYVSTVEAREFPFTATQWHPEVSPLPAAVNFALLAAAHILAHCAAATLQWVLERIALSGPLPLDPLPSLPRLRGSPVPRTQRLCLLWALQKSAFEWGNSAFPHSAEAVQIMSAAAIFFVKWANPAPAATPSTWDLRCHLLQHTCSAPAAEHPPSSASRVPLVPLVLAFPLSLVLPWAVRPGSPCTPS